MKQPALALCISKTILRALCRANAAHQSRAISLSDTEGTDPSALGLKAVAESVRSCASGDLAAALAALAAHAGWGEPAAALIALVEHQARERYARNLAKSYTNISVASAAQKLALSEADVVTCKSVAIVVRADGAVT